MVRLDIALVRAAGEAAAVVVPELQGPQQPRRDDALAAFVVEQIPLCILNELRDVRVAGDLAGVLLVDAPVGVDMEMGAASCRLPGKFVAPDGEHYFVAFAALAGAIRQVVLGHLDERVGIALLGARELELQPSRQTGHTHSVVIARVCGGWFRFRGNIVGSVRCFFRRCSAGIALPL